MSTDLFTKAVANSAEQGRDESQHEAAKIGAAAERKRLEESELAAKAWGESADRNGRAVSWQRRIRVDGEVRHVTMWERDGAYSERAFLRLANRAAAQAVPGGWKNGEAVESVAAEIVARVMTRTCGRMPKRGSLATSDRAADPDFSYLVSMGRFAAADALGGAAAGLSAEVAPMAAGEGAGVADLASLAAESLAAAESAPDADRYLAESPTAEHWSQRPVAQWASVDWTWAESLADSCALVLTPTTTTAVRRVAIECGERTRAVEAAIVCAIRPAALAAELAEAGYGSSAGAVRKAASLGRGILADALRRIPTTPRHWSAADWRMVEAVAILCDLEQAERERAHVLEQAPPSYKAPTLPDYLPSQKVDPDDQVWETPAELIGYPSGALEA